jgi:RNA polymerase primary sigma factor
MAIKFTPNTEEVQAYLNSIRKYKVMTPEEETLAFKLYKATKDKAAYDMIINSNQRIVFAEAKKYAQRDAELLDYVDEGNIGLMQAIEMFDPERGYRFVTFAIWYIKRAMCAYSFSKREVKQSNAGKYIAVVAKIKKEFFQKEHRDPSVYEIADILDGMDLSVKDIRDLLSMSIKSVNDEVTEDMDYDESPEFSKATASKNAAEDEMDDEENDVKVALALAGLDDRSREIVKLSFGIGYDREYSDAEIATKFGLTNMRISQLKRGAIKRMREKLA